MVIRKPIDKISEIEDGFVVKVDNKYIFLSKEAKLVWDLCGKEKDVKEIAKKLSESYSNVEEIKIIDTLKRLELIGLLEIRDKEGKKNFFKNKKSMGIRPIKKWRIFEGRTAVKIFKPILGFLGEETYLFLSYIIPWLFYFFHLVYTGTNPFSQISHMNYVLPIFIFPILILHELAHATVSEKFGAKVGGFGIGLYKISFFFYTDTSDTLLLKRKERIKVSLAGPAVNFIFGLVFLILTWLFKNEYFFLFSSLVFLSGLASLVPIFESDGYYALMDYAMVNDLKSETFSYLKSFFSKRRANENWRGRQKIIFLIYSIFYLFSVTLIVYFFYYFFPVYIKRQIFYLCNLFSLNIGQLTDFAFGLLYLVLLGLLGIKYLKRFVNRILRTSTSNNNKF